ncbi:hypothetical protein ACJJTC_016835 [Scirpophaga incertulas]
MINIYYQNVRGLRTKVTDFYRSVCLHNYEIVCLTETWLLDTIKNSELFDDRYVVFRRDRDYKKTGESKGGGVLIAVCKDLVAEIRNDWFSNAEDLWVTLTLRCQKPSHNSHMPTPGPVLYAAATVGVNGDPRRGD